MQIQTTAFGARVVSPLRLPGTWNCRHLANANKFGHIRRVNVLLGLFLPALVTPLELLGDDDEPESQ
jgi:hypothetical protein